MTGGAFSQGECVAEPDLRDCCEPVSKNPRTFALFLSLSSPNQIVLESWGSMI